MSGYKTFAVAGAGGLGSFVVRELLKLKKDGTISAVTILTREDAPERPELAELASAGAILARVDYTSPSSLSGALTGIDVVISTLTTAALAAQAPLVAAAKTAGVRLFVPSEFGNPTREGAQGPLAHKVAIQQGLRDASVPYALFWTGPFPDFVFVSQLGFDLANGKAAIVGTGDTPISFTSRPDVARYVAHVTTALPASELANRTFKIEGERTSFNAVFKAYESATGKKVDVARRPLEEAKAALAANPADFLTFLLTAWEQGGGVVSDANEGTDSAVWPEWKPKSVVDVLTSQ